MGLSQEVVGEYYISITNLQKVPTTTGSAIEYTGTLHVHTIKNKNGTEFEYMPSMVNPNEAKSLISRLKSCMPVTFDASPEPRYGSLDNDLICANFAVHASCEIAGQNEGHIESAKYCVTFMGYTGIAVHIQTNVWIRGKVMDNLV